MALDEIFQAGAFPGDASPVFTLVHSGHQNTLGALQALESGGFVSCCQLLEAMSTWRATQDIAEKKKTNRSMTYCVCICIYDIVGVCLYAGTDYVAAQLETVV